MEGPVFLSFRSMQEKSGVGCRVTGPRMSFLQYDQKSKQ
jgi:hypothetical protein